MTRATIIFTDGVREESEYGTIGIEKKPVGKTSKGGNVYMDVDYGAKKTGWVLENIVYYFDGSSWKKYIGEPVTKYMKETGVEEIVGYDFHGSDAQEAPEIKHISFHIN